MKINRLYTAPLAMVELGINTCWQKHHTCTEGEPNEVKIMRVVKKFKHGSTAEHGRTIFKIRVENETDKSLINILENNKFFNVTYESQDSYMVSSNLRAIIEIKINNDIKKLMMSEEYHFLLGDNDE